MELTEYSEPDCETPGYRLQPREVLDLHAGLQRSMSEPGMMPLMARYGIEDIKGKPEWAASHLHPARNLNDLKPWLVSLAGDLVTARTYQVTDEMVRLAQEMQHSSPAYTEITARELPSDAGFMWLDTPVPRPSDDDGDLPPLLMHAVSWTRVPDVHMMLPAHNGRPAREVTRPGIRVRNWAWTSRTDVVPRPLIMIGQVTLPLGGGIYTSTPSLVFLRALWLLMGMEIVVSVPERPGRQGTKRASNLRSQDINVIQLRRVIHKRDDPEAPPKQIDWSCTWIVRGHDRKAPHGGTFADGRTRTWIKPYLKGPDGMPLRAADVLYRLSR